MSATKPLASKESAVSHCWADCVRPTVLGTVVLGTVVLGTVVLGTVVLGTVVLGTVVEVAVGGLDPHADSAMARASVRAGMTSFHVPVWIGSVS
jgi:hypothetical protein